jgi:RNA polymerase sigma factor (TIGR02999 family)
MAQVLQFPAFGSMDWPGVCPVAGSAHPNISTAQAQCSLISFFVILFCFLLVHFKTSKGFTPSQCAKMSHETQSVRRKKAMEGSRGPQAVSLLLRQWTDGNPDSLNELIPLVEGELRQIAKRYMRAERPGHTLQTTALINEAYLRLVGQDGIDWQSRAHFLAIAARLMRQILVDHARRSRRGKRGGGQEILPLEEAIFVSSARSSHLVNLDEALIRLAHVDSRKVQVVELRYFGGLSVEEAAQVLQVSPNTVIRDWSLAKAWLKREMESAPADEP